MARELATNWPLLQQDERDNDLRRMKEALAVGLYTEILELWDLISGELWQSGFLNPNKPGYIQYAQIALQAAQGLGNFAAECEIRNGLGWAYMERGDFSKAEAWFKSVLDCDRRTGNIGGECRTIRDLGTLAVRRNRFGTALKLYRTALRIVQAQKPDAPTEEAEAWAIREAEIYNLLGNLFLHLREYKQSWNALSHSLQKYEDLGDKYRYYLAAPLLNMGHWHFRQGHYVEARGYYQKCLQVSTELGRKDMIAGAKFWLAHVEEVEGNLTIATRLIEEAESAYNEVGMYAMRELASQVGQRLSTNQRPSWLARVLGQRVDLRRLLDFTWTAVDLLLTEPILAVKVSVRLTASVVKQLF